MSRRRAAGVAAGLLWAVTLFLALAPAQSSTEMVVSCGMPLRDARRDAATLPDGCAAAARDRMRVLPVAAVAAVAATVLYAVARSRA
jgi:hypothetical protein